MNRRVAIGATRVIPLFHPLAIKCPSCHAAGIVSRMALHAQERLVDRQKIVIGRPMRAVAVGAVLSDIGMLVDEGPLILHVAFGANGFDLHPFQVGGIRRVMRVVAVGASHLMLRHRVVRELGKFHLHLDVTAFAQLLLFMTPQLLLRPLM